MNFLEQAPRLLKEEPVGVDRLRVLTRSQV